MNTLRTWLFKILFVPATILWSAFIVCLIVLPFPLRLRLAFGWGYTTIRLARLLVGIKWPLHGLDKMPQGACVLMVNHQSTWETAFLPNLKLRQVWVLKKELMMLPFFGWALAVLRPVPIDRKQKRQAMQKVIAEGRQRIESGYSVILFPEGTRAPADAPLPFKLGAARLAAALGVPAVPIAHNAGQFWPKRGLMHPGTVHVVVGEPIDPHGKTPAEINAIAETWINDTRARLVAAEKTRRGEA